MADQQHLITPPHDKVYWWWEEACKRPPSSFYEKLDYVAEQAAQWGADQELKACWDAIYDHEGQPLCGGTAEWLHAARRPKLKSRKQRALDALTQMEDQCLGAELATEIRQALEELPDD